MTWTSHFISLSYHTRPNNNKIIIFYKCRNIFGYLSLKKPGNCFFSERQAQVLIVSVWVVIVAVNMPLLFWFDLVSFGPSLTICNIVGVNATTLAFYFLFGRTFMFFLPLCITISSYFGIWYKLAFSKRQVNTRMILNIIKTVGEGPNIRTIFSNGLTYVMEALVRMEVLPDTNAQKSKLIRWNALKTISLM